VRLGSGVRTSDPVSAGSATALKVTAADLSGEIDTIIADIEEMATTNALSITQLQSDASALIAFRVVGDGGSARLELFSAAGEPTTIRADAARIVATGSITGPLIDVTTLLAETAFITDLRVGTINYVDGSVQTQAIQQGAVNRSLGGISDTDTGPVIVGATQVRTDDLATIDMGPRGGTLTAIVTAVGTASGSVSPTTLRLLLDGAVVAEQTIVGEFDSGGLAVTITRSVTLAAARVVGPGNRVASVEMVNGGGGGGPARFTARNFLATGLLA